MQCKVTARAAGLQRQRYKSQNALHNQDRKLTEGRYHHLLINVKISCVQYEVIYCLVLKLAASMSKWKQKLAQIHIKSLHCSIRRKIFPINIHQYWRLCPSWTFCRHFVFEWNLWPVFKTHLGHTRQKLKSAKATKEKRRKCFVQKYNATLVRVRRRRSQRFHAADWLRHKRHFHGAWRAEMRACRGATRTIGLAEQRKQRCETPAGGRH